MTNDDLLLGIEAARAGNLQQARVYLTRVVQLNPASEEGWLWLGHSLNDPTKREFCYQKVLALNPNNETARRALISLQSTLPAMAEMPLKSTRQQATPPSAEKAVPQTQFRSRGKNKAKSKNENKFLFFALGFILVLLFCGLPLAFITLTGKLDLYFPQIAQSLPMAYPPTTTPPPSATPSPVPSATLTLTPVPATATRNPTMVAMANKLEAEGYSAEATSAMSRLDCAAAIPLWDKAIALDDNNDKYHYQRATCYYGLTFFQRSQEEHHYYLSMALADLNKAIVIRPNADYYASRYEALVGLGDSTDLTVDAQYFYRRASEDMSVAISWGQGGLAKRKLAASMIYGGQCEAGLPEVQKLINQQNDDLGYLYQLESVAYACLGDLEGALKSVGFSENNSGDHRNSNHKAAYLYQVGQSQKALEVINQSIDQSLGYNGERYFLRALIYYEMGKKNLAAQDLATGQGNTWGRGGLLAYVQGKITFENGNKQEAIEDLQLAEASLPVIYTSMRLRIQKELADLGAHPLVLTPSPEMVALSDKLASIPATPASPDASIGITPSPTLAAVGNTALATRPNGTTRFVDYDGGFEVIIPSGWLAFRPNAPEFYKIMEQEGPKNEFLRKVMEIAQTGDLNMYRLYAVFPASQERDSRDLASINIQRFSENVSLDEAVLSTAQSLKDLQFTVLRNELMVTSSGMVVGVIEFEQADKSPFTGELLMYYHKNYLFKTDKGLGAISLTTIEPLKDFLFPELEKVLETVNLLH